MIFRFLLLLPLAVVGLVQQAQPESFPSGPTESVKQQDPDVDKQDDFLEQTVSPAQVFPEATFPKHYLSLERLPIYKMKKLGRTQHTTGKGKETGVREEQDEKPGEEQGERRADDHENFILFLKVNRTQETRQHPVSYTCMCSQESPEANKVEKNQSYANVSVHADDWLEDSREQGGKEDKVRSSKCRSKKNKVRSSCRRGKKNEVKSCRHRGQRKDKQDNEERGGVGSSTGSCMCNQD